MSGDAQRSFFLPLVNVDGLDAPTPRAVKALSDSLDRGVRALAAGDEATGFALLAKGFMSAEIRWIDVREVLRLNRGLVSRLSAERAPDIFSVKEASELTESQRHAFLVKAHVKEHMRQNPRSEIARYTRLFPIDAVVKAYEGKKKMAAGETEQAIMDIKKALQMDERTNMTSYWSLFTLTYGLYLNTAFPQDQVYWAESRRALESFTRLAPPCHWHSACAFFMLFIINFEVFTGENAVELTENVPKGRRKGTLSRLLSRLPPSKVDELLETYRKGLRCLEMRSKWLPPLGKDQMEDTVGPAKALAKLFSEVVKENEPEGQRSTADDLKLLKECALCGRKDASLLKCSRCGIAAYCGKEHQKEHWKTHKGECAQLQKAAEMRLKDNHAIHERVRREGDGEEGQSLSWNPINSSSMASIPRSAFEAEVPIPRREAATTEVHVVFHPSHLPEDALDRLQTVRERTRNPMQVKFHMYGSPETATKLREEVFGVASGSSCIVLLNRGRYTPAGLGMSASGDERNRSVRRSVEIVGVNAPRSLVVLYQDEEDEGDDEKETLLTVKQAEDQTCNRCIVRLANLTLEVGCSEGVVCEAYSRGASNEIPPNRKAALVMENVQILCGAVGADAEAARGTQEWGVPQTVGGCARPRGGRGGCSDSEGPWSPGVTVGMGGELFMAECVIRDGPLAGVQVSLGGSAVFRRCKFSGLGKGEEEPLDEDHIQGAQPALSLNEGSNVRLWGCTFEDNEGHAVQFDSRGPGGVCSLPDDTEREAAFKIMGNGRLETPTALDLAMLRLAINGGATDVTAKEKAVQIEAEARARRDLWRRGGSYSLAGPCVFRNNCRSVRDPTEETQRDRRYDSPAAWHSPESEIGQRMTMQKQGRMQLGDVLMQGLGLPSPADPNAPVGMRESFADFLKSMARAVEGDESAGSPEEGGHEGARLGSDEAASMSADEGEGSEASALD
uniref:MYND-type domain-containing protein n=1 Tax=Chromera velia CCMP2878 TaxID=1169474 RepID=A0A0G4F783_9ALVE|eukprot:Cvel_2908.t1-p1 / transcript=Cvel_2908.t1 / gene=Cvel_2908 / organism=Chromera_velia_CCMP2878 / gene_product=hypothetical protein / transcript_product=hypothetical protein / location=Cvel_scaffold115:40996-47047(+) / protein_length=958 / sequence_SO=supercontig / SO=protein_coding / is_pseudo=false